MPFTFNNPIAYYKLAMAQNVDSKTRSAVATTTMYNGMLVTLSGVNTGTSAGMGYVWNATATTANTATDVWMVRSPEVSKTIPNNLFTDPRAFEIPAGTVFDVIKLEVNDIIHLSAAAFGTNQKPNTSNTFVVAAANGQYIAQANATGVTGIVFKLALSETIPVGQEFVEGYVLEVVQNPTGALA